MLPKHTIPSNVSLPITNYCDGGKSNRVICARHLVTTINAMSHLHYVKRNGIYEVSYMYHTVFLQYMITLQLCLLELLYLLVCAKQVQNRELKDGLLSLLSGISRAMRSVGISCNQIYYTLIEQQCHRPLHMKLWMFCGCKGCADSHFWSCGTPLHV